MSDAIDGRLRESAIPVRYLFASASPAALARICRFTCVILATFMLAACSDKPSSSDVTDQVKKELLGEPMAHVTHLKRVNGYKRDDNHYVALVSYHIVMLKGLDQVRDEATGEKTDTITTVATGLGLFALGLKFGGSFQKGDEFDVTDRYVFLKTDKGWMLQGLDQS